MTKEVPLKERIEKLYESGYVNEFNYLENQLQEARYLVTILHKQTEEKDKEIKRLNKELQQEKKDFEEVNDYAFKLNNIINELEKWLEEKQELTCGCGITRDYLYAYENVLDHLNELKEGK